MHVPLLPSLATVHTSGRLLWAAGGRRSSPARPTLCPQMLEPPGRCSPEKRTPSGGRERVLFESMIREGGV